MTDACLICGHEKAMSRCWRLTCPENGGSMALLDQVRSRDVNSDQIGNTSTGRLL